MYFTMSCLYDYLHFQKNSEEDNCADRNTSQIHNELQNAQPHNTSPPTHCYIIRFPPGIPFNQVRVNI